MSRMPWQFKNPTQSDHNLISSTAKKARLFVRTLGAKTLMAGAPEMAQMMEAISEDMKRQGFNPRKGFRMTKDGKILARRLNRSVGEFHLPDDLPTPIRSMFDDLQKVITYRPGDDAKPIVDLIQHYREPPLYDAETDLP